MNFHFAGFELDVDAWTLRRRGRPVHIERRPMDLLILLVERSTHLVSRADIVSRLWGDTVFVDVDMGVNTAIRKVRQALNDSPDAPRFIETVPGKGYRFIGKLEPVVQPSASSVECVSIAVLPFQNLTADPDKDYLAAGLTEEATVSLGQIDPDRLLVVGRTPVFAYRPDSRTGVAQTPGEMGKQLGTAFVLEGSVRCEGERLRVTTKLIRVQDLVQVWSASYDHVLIPSSMLAFQRGLSTAIAEQVRLRLSPERLTVLEKRQTRNSEAFDLYLRGRHLWNQLTPVTTRSALEYYTRATVIDPEYALAFSGLADAWATAPITGDGRPLEIRPRVWELSERALKCGPELAEAHTSHGFLKLFLDWEWLRAEEAFRKAIALDPGYPVAHRMLGIALTHLARHDEARAAMARAREMDPLYSLYHALSAMVEIHGRNYPAALRFALQATAIDPGFWIAHFHLAQAYERLEEYELALDALQNAARAGGGNSKIMGLRGYVFARMGRAEEARAVLTTLEAIAQERYVPPYAMALVHAGLEQNAAAMRWLRRAYGERDVHCIFLPVDPKWDALQPDPEFVNLLHQCGFPAPALA